MNTYVGTVGEIFITPSSTKRQQWTSQLMRISKNVFSRGGPVVEAALYGPPSPPRGFVH